MAWHSMHAVPCFAHVHSDVTVPWCNFSQITELCAVYQMATPVRSRVWSRDYVTHRFCTEQSLRFSLLCASSMCSTGAKSCLSGK
jgi:hypothetical protein